MRRAGVAGIVGVLAALALLTWSWAAPAPPAPASLVDRLTKTADFKGFEGPKTTLGDALEQLAQLYDVDFEINDRAFKPEQVMDVARTEIAQPAIPPVKRATLERVLRKVLDRIPVPSGATFLVRRDCIEITTNQFVSMEVYGDTGNAPYKGPHLPLVNRTITPQPLDEALGQLAEQADFNILVDNRAREQSKTEVSARLRNTPLDSAVRLLADMAGLRVVHLDNVLYVTTIANAAALDARLNKEYSVPSEAQDDNSPPVRLRKGGDRGFGIRIANGGA